MIVNRAPLSRRCPSVPPGETQKKNHFQLNNGDQDRFSKLTPELEVYFVLGKQKKKNGLLPRKPRRFLGRCHSRENGGGRNTRVILLNETEKKFMKNKNIFTGGHFGGVEFFCVIIFSGWSNPVGHSPPPSPSAMMSRSRVSGRESLLPDRAPFLSGGGGRSPSPSLTRIIFAVRRLLLTKLDRSFRRHRRSTRGCGGTGGLLQPVVRLLGTDTLRNSRVMQLTESSWGKCDVSEGARSL